MISKQKARKFQRKKKLEWTLKIGSQIKKRKKERKKATHRDNGRSPSHELRTIRLYVDRNKEGGELFNSRAT